MCVCIQLNINLLECYSELVLVLAVVSVTELNTKLYMTKSNHIFVLDNEIEDQIELHIEFG